MARRVFVWPHRWTGLLLAGSSFSRASPAAYSLSTPNYAAQSSRDVRAGGWNTSLWLDGDTGALRSLLPTGEHSGNTVSS